MPMQPTPPPFYPQQTPWIPPFMGMQAPPYQAFCQQVSPYQMTQTTQDGTNPTKKRRMYYCHTHGACYHPSPKCRNKAPGHQDNATFANRMGGSTKNVRGIQQASQNQPPT